MKLLLENWKQYIKESEKKEFSRSLYDFAGYDSSIGEPSIGYGQVNDPSFISRSKEIMSKTGDNWVIITLSNVNEAEEQVASSQFKSWLQEKNYPKGSKIIVVGAARIDKTDYVTPEWILHDVLGHVIGDEYFFKVYGARSSALAWLNPYTFSIMRGTPKDNKVKELQNIRKSVVSKLITILPQDVSPAEAEFDKLYDIFSAIAMGYITLDQALAVLDTEEEKALGTDIVNFANDWVSNFPVDTPIIKKSW